MLKQKLQSVFFNKCPVCLKGDFFIYKNPFDLKKFDEMHNQCSNCKELFNKEVGFYYGAMYVSYGLNIALGVGLFLLMVLLLKLDLLVFLFSFLGIVILLFPFTMRTSRLIWINLFSKFDEIKNKQ